MVSEINLGTSVFKREASSIERVERKLLGDGWEKTGQPTSRVRYYEKSGINITAVDGVRGTIVMPSGPIRGSIFGKNVKLFSDVSVIGGGKSSNSETKDSPQSTPRDGTPVVN